MKILVLGGTRFFGIQLVWALLEKGHRVTIATRGLTRDPFGPAVERVIVDRTDPSAMKAAFSHRSFHTVCDDLAYCSNDVKTALDSLHCSRYVMVSSAAVYSLRPGVCEQSFDPLAPPLRWGCRADFDYAEGKSQAERALFGEYPLKQAAAVRFPFVLGPGDYTRRLYFYVEHAVRRLPLYVDAPEAQLSFIHQADAGRFLAWLAAESPLTGPVNACCPGTASVADLLGYVRSRTGGSPLLCSGGAPAPYNGTPAHSLDTRRAQGAGFSFSPLQSWLPGLLDRCILEAQRGLQP